MVGTRTGYCAPSFFVDAHTVNAWEQKMIINEIERPISELAISRRGRWRSSSRMMRISVSGLPSTEQAAPGNCLGFHTNSKYTGSMRILPVATVLSVLCFAGCQAPKPPAPPAKPTTAPTAKRYLAHRPSKAVVRNVHYGNQGWSEKDEKKTNWMFVSGHLQPKVVAHAAPAGVNLFAAHGAFDLEDDGESFVGTDRALPKTKPATASPRTVELADLLSEFKPGQAKSDSNMRNHHTPTMVKDWDFDRVAEEEDNVTVEGWIVATKKESDNDFHVILAAEADLADQPNPDRWKLMNVEVTGLPPTGAPRRADLASVRNEFKNFFVPTVPDSETSSYTMLQPVHVRITGSLFFDVDHPAGAVGPGPLKPKTAWEIHPITSLEFLSN